MKFFFNPETYQFINDFNFEPNLELELRFGSKIKGRDFYPDIGQELFEKLRLNLGAKYENKNDESTVDIYQKNKKIIRKISTGGEIKYEEKLKLRNIDIPYHDFDMRISLAKELPIKMVKLDESERIEIRRRKRTTFYGKQNKYLYVLTEVFSEKYKKTSFEFEIEYKIKEGSNLRAMFHESVNNIIDFIVGDKTNDSYISLHDMDYIRGLAYSIRETKPINLPRNKTGELYSLGYTVTNKLDGERFMAIFSQYGLYYINRRKMEKINNNFYNDTVLDTEYFKGTFYIFDCMIYQGEDVKRLPLYERLEKARMFLEDKKDSNFILKTFYTPDQLIKSTAFLLENLNREDNDGLIFTPNSYYMDKRYPIYKWKFPQKMALDFMVRRASDDLYDLYVKKDEQLIPFTGNKKYPLSRAFYEDKSNQLVNDKIYEFKYENEKFVLLRERPDKTDPNYYTVAENVWEDIMNPYTEEELLKLLKPKVLEEYRKYHNLIKRGLIDEFCQQNKILDLGIGRGGDLGKYEEACVSYLWGVEPLEINYKEFEKRLDNRPFMKKRTTLIIGKAEDTDKISETIGSDKVDVVASFFSLSFFFNREGESYPNLDKLVDTIDKTLKDERGFFIGTTIDGEKTRELLENDNKFDFGEGYIRLLDKDDNKVEVEIRDTIVETQLEYLVDFQLLVSKLKEKNILLEKSNFFKDGDSLSGPENILNSLYRTFVFKIHDSNDKLFANINLLCKDLDMEWIVSSAYKSTICDLVKDILNKNKENKGENRRWLGEIIIKLCSLSHENVSHENVSHENIIKIYLTDAVRGENFIIKKDLELKNMVNKSKDLIDCFINNDNKKDKFYGIETNKLDYFSFLRKEIGIPYVTNAFLKCWEMIQDFDLIPANHNSDYTVFCNAELPGAFIFAINYYIKTRTSNPSFKWYGNSLWPSDSEILGDSFKLYEKNKDNWLMNGKEYSGDVLDLKMIDYIKERIGGTVDLYTSDIGIPLNVEDLNNQETLETPLNLGQVICGLVSLKNGGHLVCKMFLFFSKFNMSLLSILNNLFDEFYISKPVSSRPANSEIYIIGKGYKGYNKEAMTELLQSLVLWKTKDMSNEQISEIKEEFYATLIYASYKIYQRQIYFIEKNVRLIKDYYNTHNIHNFEDKERYDMVVDWVKTYPLGNITKEKIHTFE